MSKVRSLGVAAVFLAGCAVGGASSRFVVPPASAQQAATLTKWEYTCFHADDGDGDDLARMIAAKSRAMGQQGWEMSAATNLEWCFKRPM